MFVGGIADKLGNAYETRWVIRKFIEVVGGKANWIRLEGITKEFSGFEFAIGLDNSVEWHQTKISISDGNWTINALKREGVLKAFRARLEANARNRCVFVSQNPAKELQPLASKAKIANDAAEFRASLGKGHEENFATLLTEWGATDEIGYEWLSRSDFITIPQSEIESYTKAYLDLYLVPSSISDGYEVLRSFLEERFNKIITTTSAREDLRSGKKIQFKEWSLDKTLPERIRQATSSYLETYIPFGAGGAAISRSQAKNVLAHIQKPDGPIVILVTGVAGSGKSGVIREVIDQLAATDVTHLAFRVDHNLLSTTPSILGEILIGRQESITTTLKGLEPFRRAVLIIDQVDAVSEISGRNGAIREVVLQLVNEARIYKNICVLIVCRSFDFDNDHRLKVLKDGEGVVQIDIPLLSWDNDVKPLLTTQHVECELLNQKQRNLLCLPLNLAIFLQVKGSSSASFATRNDLFERLIEVKDRSIRRERLLSWGIEAPLIDLADWMSDRQRLDAPREVIAKYGSAVDLLSSEGLIVKSKGNINFFHESFFDYIYARGFGQKDRSIVDLLESAEQHLFRRTQVRQILETLRQSEPKRYERELADVLQSLKVRFHIKAAVAQWLGSLPDPTAAERETVLSLDSDQPRFPLLVRSALLGSPGWFDRLVEVRWIQETLESGRDERVHALKWWLSEVASVRPDAVISLLEGWWAVDPVRADELLDWFDFLNYKAGGKELADFCERVIRSKPSNLFVENRAYRRQFTPILWAEQHADHSAGVLEALFDVWFDEHPERHPFERDAIGDLDQHSFGELAKKAPGVFLRGTTKAFVRSIELSNQRRGRGEWDSSFKHRRHSGHRFGEDEFVGFYRDALKIVSVEDPPAARAILACIDPALHEVCAHIHLEVVVANGKDFSASLVRLLSNEFLFEAGWDGAKWRSFADAAKAALPHLAPTDVQRVERVILNHMPEIELAAWYKENHKNPDKKDPDGRNLAIYCLRKSGSDQLSILCCIGPSLLSDRARSRLEELQRKFPNFVLPDPDHNVVHAVESPIRSRNAEKMKDEHWLAAIARYNSEELRGGRYAMVEGGARQLAGEIHQLSKADPKRFGALLLKLPQDVHKTYVTHILLGLIEAEKCEESTLIQAIEFAHAHSTADYGIDIARIFEKAPEIAKNPGTLDILLWYVEHGAGPNDQERDVEHAKDRSLKIEDLFEHGSRFHVSGINSVRGWAAEALGAVLWAKVPGVADKAWVIVERRIETDTSVSVRSCLVHPLIPLYNIDRERAAELFLRLCEPPVSAVRKKDAELLERLAISLMLPRTWVPKFSKALSVSFAANLEYYADRAFRRSEMNSASDNSEWLYPLTSRRSTNFLPHIVVNVPPLGRKLLYRLVSSRVETTHLIGAWHAFRAAFQLQEYVPFADHLMKRGLNHRRLAADVASRALVHDEFRDRAEKQIQAFFDDQDKNVRSEASDVFRYIDASDFGRFYELAVAYVNSAAFEEQNSFSFLHRLEDATCDVQALVVRAAERLMDDFEQNGAAGGRRHGDLHQLQDLLKREYAASEGDADLRSRLLDLIDKMLERELYGIDGVVVAHER